jgi:hypothetical protein
MRAANRLRRLCRYLVPLSKTAVILPKEQWRRNNRIRQIGRQAQRFRATSKQVLLLFTTYG